MNDMSDRLRDLRTVEPHQRATDSEVAADLLRGRSALRQRRLRWATGAAMAGVAVVAGTIIVTTGDAGSPARHRDQAATQHQGMQTGGIRLVSYTGGQQPGFTVTTVPAGYVLQGAQPGSLDIAPPGDNSPLDTFTGKLVVMLQSVDATPDHSGTQVTVNGRAGYIQHGEDATGLEYTDGEHDIVVQAWNNIHLSDDQLVQFAAGITVTASAQEGRG
jgi:hypothetical protein